MALASLDHRGHCGAVRPHEAIPSSPGTATSGTAAANINGITVHSARKFSKDTTPRRGRHADVDGFTVSRRREIRQMNTCSSRGQTWPAFAGPT